MKKSGSTKSNISSDFLMESSHKSGGGFVSGEKKPAETSRSSGSSGGTNEEGEEGAVLSNEGSIYLFLQRKEIGLTPEEAKKSSDALGR